MSGETAGSRPEQTMRAVSGEPAEDRKAFWRSSVLSDEAAGIRWERTRSLN